MILDTFHKVMRRRIQLGGGRSILRAVGGRRLHHYEVDGRGPGPALVLVHGLGGTANSFGPILFGLRRTWSRIYALDLPGHGFSPLEPGETPLDVHGHHGVLKAFLDEVVKEPAALVGNSMGGALSVQTAIERPERVPAVGLLSPAGAPLGEEGLAAVRRGFNTRTRKDALELIGRMLHRTPRGSWLVANDFRRAFDTPVVHRVLTNATAEETLDVEALRALTMPIAFVWGASDRLLPGDGYDFFKRHLPAHARIELFAACGHVPMLEQPRRTLEVLDALGREAAAVNGSGLRRTA